MFILIFFLAMLKIWIFFILAQKRKFAYLGFWCKMLYRICVLFFFSWCWVLLKDTSQWKISIWSTENYTHQSGGKCISHFPEKQSSFLSISLMFFSPLSGHSLLGSLCHHHPLPFSQYSTGFSVACFWMFSIEICHANKHWKFIFKVSTK